MPAELTRGQLVERVVKLLARAAADHGAEAQSAANLARLLMRRHGITRGDLPRKAKTRRTAVAPAPSSSGIGAPANSPGAPANSPGNIPVRVRIGDFEIRFRL